MFGVESPDEGSVHEAPVVRNIRVSSLESDLAERPKNIVMDAAPRCTFLFDEGSEGPGQSSPLLLGASNMTAFDRDLTLGKELKNRNSECVRKLVERLKINGVDQPILETLKLRLWQSGTRGDLPQRQATAATHVLHAASDVPEIEACTHRRASQPCYRLRGAA